MILSIDIGRRNLGYVIGNKQSLTMGLYDIDEGKRGKGVLYRTVRIHEFLKEKFDKYPIEVVIIEKQVPQNKVAMEIMYLFVSAVYFYCKKVILYNPKRKFTSLSVNYTTKHKAHKKLAIDLVKNYLEKYKPEDYYIFETFTKQDDISDALLMMLTYMYKRDKEELMKIRSCANEIGEANELREPKINIPAEKELERLTEKELEKVYWSQEAVKERQEVEREEVEREESSNLDDILDQREYLLGLL